MDKLSHQKRSYIMSKIKSKGNKTTEWRFRAILIRHGIKGWKVNYVKIDGNPDFYFIDKSIAVFIDGCFWHGCNKCKKSPKTNNDYWRNKFIKNRARDKLTNRKLRARGIKVIRFWEHEIQNNIQGVYKKIGSLGL